MQSLPTISKHSIKLGFYTASAETGLSLQVRVWPAQIAAVDIRAVASQGYVLRCGGRPGARLDRLLQRSQGLQLKMLASTGKVPDRRGNEERNNRYETLLSTPAR